MKQTFNLPVHLDKNVTRVTVEVPKRQSLSQLNARYNIILTNVEQFLESNYCLMKNNLKNTTESFNRIFPSSFLTEPSFEISTSLREQN